MSKNQDLEKFLIGKTIKSRRIIEKNGECNIFRGKSRRKGLILLDFNNIVNSSWTWTIFVFLSTLLLSWFIFAVIWWLICYTHGDFEPDHLPPFQAENNFKPCIYQVNNFASCFLFSIETQHTVGYGIKAPTEECPEAIFVNATQCIIGFVMQGFMAVVIFTKMTLPKLRSRTLLFSKFAAISLNQTGKLCLFFRVGDMRRNHIIEASVKAYLVSHWDKTDETNLFINQQIELNVQSDNCKTIFFKWPIIMMHEINSDSPLYFLPPSDFSMAQKNNAFEIIVVLEGTVESTGQMTQAKTSYTCQEIIWGRKFDDLLRFDSERQEYQADFSRFDQLKPVSTPMCSAAYLDNFPKMQGQFIGSSQIQLDFTPRNSVGENGEIIKRKMRKPKQND